MKARIGFVLFVFVFFITAVVAPLIERISFFLQRMVQAFSFVGERFIRGTRFVAKKISLAEWKNVLQKPS